MGAVHSPLISLCMIVKNEEKNIVRCLSSVKDYVNEILVLDTGSTDWTPLLAREMGAKVYFGRWENDFSKARNESKKHARGEWILYLDADEEITPETGEKIRRLAENKRVEGYTFSIINYTASDKNSPQQIGINLRMFRNKPNYRFEGAVHEQIKSSILRENPAAQIVHSGLSILHHGYCTDNPRRQQKTRRNIEILEKVLAQNPQDHFSHYNLAVSYYVSGRLEKAKTHYLLAKKYVQRSAGYLPALYRNFAVCLYDLAEYENAVKLIDEGLSFFPDYPDLYYLLGQIHASLKLYEQAENYFKTCLKFTRTNPHYITTKGVESFLSHEQLADIFYQTGKWDQALAHQAQAVKAGALSRCSALRLANMAKQRFDDGEEVYRYLLVNLPGLGLAELIKLIFNAGLYELVLKKINLLPGETKPEILLIAAQSAVHLKRWAEAQEFISGIPNTSPEYGRAQVLGCLCCCLSKDLDGLNGYMREAGKKYPSFVECCKPVIDIFTGRGITNVKNIFCPAGIDFIYRLIHFDSQKTIAVLSNCLNSSQFAGICYELSKKFLAAQNYQWAEKLLALALKQGCRSAKGYRLYGQTCIEQEKYLEGIYFIRQGCIKQKNDAANYLGLLKSVTSYFQRSLRKMVGKYPRYHQAKHHLLSMAAFNAKLPGREELL
ncbi:glycosyltransferase involved in cell wall biosynthesis [Desulfohalotomaculum tongense]|uniref:glycosyltransferase family 2 protein n=1 Tax=Desulforadius tongensis TaxID=1216062 RepID=UPI00195927FC|nr:glycosyltransferase family 2 protein [Desulforadius tongensis]MBM7854296.1 glycosyltransferase involved in cell wall biosynthesis [Desulforadius tongensis]